MQVTARTGESCGPCNAVGSSAIQAQPVTMSGTRLVLGLGVGIKCAFATGIMKARAFFIFALCVVGAMARYVGANPITVFVGMRWVLDDLLTCARVMSQIECAAAFAVSRYSFVQSPKG